MPALGAHRTFLSGPTMNTTALLALVSSCIGRILKESVDKNDGSKQNSTASVRTSDENSYFFVLFVMFFYSFLALVVFLGHLRSKKKKSQTDPYEEFINGREDKNGSAFKFDFEEESIL